MAQEAATGYAPATVPVAGSSDASAAGGERGLQWLTSDVDAPLMLANLRESMQARSCVHRGLALGQDQGHGQRLG